MTANILQILQAQVPEPTYGTGRPFLTTYQIAIALTQQFPNAATALGLPVGGEGHGPYALTTYIARWLSDRIRRGVINNIELRFLSPQDLSELQFDDGGNPMRATTNVAHFSSTMFRLVDDPAPAQTP